MTPIYFQIYDFFFSAPMHSLPLSAQPASAKIIIKKSLGELFFYKADFKILADLTIRAVRKISAILLSSILLRFFSHFH